MYQSDYSMSRWHRIWVLVIAAAMVAAFAAFAAPASAHDDENETATTYRVTVENLTENQTLTPAVVAAHEASFKLFTRNRPASNGLAQLAENGGVPVLVDELSTNDEVGDVAVAGSAPIPPGQTASTLITTTGEYGPISVAAMLICTNDGFAGISGAKVSDRRAETTRYGRAYDAGTEINTQSFVDLVPPCSNSTSGTGTSNPDLAENGTVQRHRGITETGDLSPATHGWDDPVIKVTIERVATYEITVTNVTSGQPITPAVFAVHNGRHELFGKGHPASNGLQQLAENGGVPVLAQEVTANSAVVASTVIGAAPLAPGTSASATIEVTGRVTRFSLAAMLVCTNDGFGGIDGKKLPTRIGDERHYNARAYDAGTEINTENFSDLVPPCDGDPTTGTGMSNPDLAEGATVQHHHGIGGVGDLTSVHEWSGPVLEITIERIG
ncbi:hypothetical protein MNBD_ACTINO01-106 [hydrothermal vent metagenome]|uniref:Spondin domain-containing protein n=1 Tax=hydrothermal vent metagenome TaxID=652676 RepID=A0A3B0RWP7_9ZZZZ